MIIWRLLIIACHRWVTGLDTVRMTISAKRRFRPFYRFSIKLDLPTTTLFPRVLWSMSSRVSYLTKKVDLSFKDFLILQYKRRNHDIISLGNQHVLWWCILLDNVAITLPIDFGFSRLIRSILLLIEGKGIRSFAPESTIICIVVGFAMNTTIMWRVFIFVGRVLWWSSDVIDIVDVNISFIWLRLVRISYAWMVWLAFKLHLLFLLHQ